MAPARRSKRHDSLFSFENFRKYHGDIFTAVLSMIYGGFYFKPLKQVFGPFAMIHYLSEESGADNALQYGIGIKDFFSLFTFSIASIVLICFSMENLGDFLTPKNMATHKRSWQLRFSFLMLPFYLLTTIGPIFLFYMDLKEKGFTVRTLKSYFDGLAAQYPYTQILLFTKIFYLSVISMSIAMMLKCLILKFKPEQINDIMRHSITSLLVVSALFVTNLGNIGIYILFFYGFAKLCSTMYTIFQLINKLKFMKSVSKVLLFVSVPVSHVLGLTYSARVLYVGMMKEEKPTDIAGGNFNNFWYRVYLCVTVLFLNIVTAIDFFEGLTGFFSQLFKLKRQSVPPKTEPVKMEPKKKLKKT